ncbi:2-amino-4-hydroxy-6-hydroxymethyldihydropteridine diphosphokinase [Photobacterium damselae]|uniref:2-amino-4-hydroxy-6- hydroxymethyldihydropteridine diphosphokinase n=1 Tax=Photobacterium damselae TaxID=38293 RepID=UPI0025434A54
MNTCYISIGSNIEPEYHLVMALKELRLLSHGQLRVSRIFQAEPVGFDGDSFYNCVVEIKTSSSVDILQSSLKALEIKYGRPIDAKKNQDRTLDLDILLFGNEIRERDPQLPRDDLYKFAFVLWPMYELAPEFVVPNDGRSIAELYREIQFQQQLQPVTLATDSY